MCLSAIAGPDPEGHFDCFQKLNGFFSDAQAIRGFVVSYHAKIASIAVIINMESVQSPILIWMIIIETHNLWSQHYMYISVRSDKVLELSC